MDCSSYYSTYSVVEQGFSYNMDMTELHILLDSWCISDLGKEREFKNITPEI